MTLIIKREDATTLFGKRVFDASPQRLFDAHTQPDLIQRWMVGPDGWEMMECNCDPIAGGKIAYKWKNKDHGAEFSLSGEFIELDSPHRIVHIERMHLPDATPDVRVETIFESKGTNQTFMKIRMVVDDEQTMDAMIASGMDVGMEASYSYLDDVVK